MNTGQPETTSYVHSPFPVRRVGDADVLVFAKTSLGIADAAAAVPDRLMNLRRSNLVIGCS